MTSKLSSSDKEVVKESSAPLLEKILYRNSDIVSSKKIVMNAKHKNIIFDKVMPIFVAEFFATFFLMFIGCMSIFGSPTEYATAPSLQPGFTFGFIVAVLISTFGHISNAHLNPAVTVCSVLLGFTSPLLSIVYFLAELTGATCGFWMLKVLCPGDLYSSFEKKTPYGLCTTIIHPEMHIFKGFMFEFISTALLIYLVCAVWDRRNKSDAIPLRFGVLITAISFAVGPFTGASMNPARTFGPAIIQNQWKDHWVYWVAPISASVFATFSYKYLLMASPYTPIMVKDKSSEKSDANDLDEKSLKDGLKA